MWIVLSLLCLLVLYYIIWSIIFVRTAEVLPAQRRGHVMVAFASVLLVIPLLTFQVGKFLQVSFSHNSLLSDQSYYLIIIFSCAYHVAYLQNIHKQIMEIVNVMLVLISELNKSKSLLENRYHMLVLVIPPFLISFSWKNRG